MHKIATSLLAGTAFLGLAAAAHGADMGSPLRGPAVVQPLGGETVATGWYLRGDVGVVLEGKTGFESIESDYLGAPLSKSIDTDKLSSAPRIGIGIGYQFNQYLRGDITADFYATRKLRAHGTYTGYDSANAMSTNNRVGWESDLSSAVVLANVYGDLGTYSGFTPYVGAGIGAAYRNLSTTLETASWDYSPNTTPAGAGTTKWGQLPGQNKWSFAYALHTGFSYDLAPNLKLDVGYSFKDLGKLNGGGQAVCNSGGSCGDEVTNLKRLQFHDFHVGARWMFDQPQPVYSAPVIAKY